MADGVGRQETVAGPVAELGGRAFTIDDLAQLNRMSVVGLVLPNVAHEVNNALQVVSGVVEMLAARPDLPPDVVDKLGRIGLQSGRASSLIRELVSFSRRDQARVGVADVRKVVESAVTLRRYHLARDRVAVVVDLPEAACLARLDAHYLQQVIVNLVINAEQAMRGRPGAELGVHVLTSDASVEVIVEDNGGGLAGEAQQRAGDLFFSTRPSPALGLGLAVSCALVEAQGGRLTVEPTELGTRARIVVPRYAAASA